MSKIPISIIPAPTTRHFVATKPAEDAVIVLTLNYQQMDSLRDVVAQAVTSAKSDLDNRLAYIESLTKETDPVPGIQYLLVDQERNQVNYLISVLADCDRVLGMFPDGQR